VIAPKTHRRVILVVGAAAYLAIAVCYFARIWQRPGYLIIGGHGDAEQFAWFLQWTPFAVSHGHNPLFTDFINYPRGVNLMWNTSVFLPGMVVAPLTALAGPVVAYNAVMTLAPALAATCAMFAICRYGSVGAAWAGGLLYGFSPYMIAQSFGHANLVLTAYLPLLLLLLDEILVRQRRGVWTMGVALGLLTAVQFLTGEEVLGIALIGAAMTMGVTAALAWHQVRPRLPHGARVLGVSVAVFGLTCGWPAYFQFFGPERVLGAIQPGGVYVADLLSYVVPTRLEVLAPGWAVAVSGRFTGNLSELGAYLGVVLIGLMVLTTIRLWRLLAVRIAALTGAGLVVLSFGPRLHLAGSRLPIPLPGIAIDRLPVVRDVLAVRLALGVYLSAAILFALFLDAAWKRDWPVRWLGLSAVVAAIALLVPNYPFPAAPDLTPPFFRSPPARLLPGEVVLLAPLSRDAGSTEPMLWQAESGMRFKTPSGYFTGSSAAPPLLGGRLSNLAASMRDAESGAPARSPSPAEVVEMRGELTRLRISTVAVGPSRGEATEIELFTTLLGHRPEENQGVYVWWDVTSN